jgi:hypothetical protein
MYPSVIPFNSLKFVTILIITYIWVEGGMLKVLLVDKINDLRGAGDGET